MDRVGATPGHGDDVPGDRDLGRLQLLVERQAAQRDGAPLEVAHDRRVDAPVEAGAPVADVGEFVGEQGSASALLRLVGAVRERDAVADGVGLRRDRARGGGGGRIGVDADTGEVMGEALLEVRPGGSVERVTGGGQRLPYEIVPAALDADPNRIDATRSIDRRLDDGRGEQSNHPCRSPGP